MKTSVFINIITTHFNTFFQASQKVIQYEQIKINNFELYFQKVRIFQRSCAIACRLHSGPAVQLGQPLDQLGHHGDMRY